ncbi:hypothetical protein NXF25_021369 [Crotalus adamanteus]|uniref:Ig-like domain-containing protein n=1 Tax=Crotalus adamanteus TaxID=8729 RepID=A0AAW1B768_CROAD
MYQFLTMNLASFSLILLVLMSRTLLCQAEKPVQEPLLEALNGRKADISCSHPNIQNNEHLFWFRQFPSQPPHFIATGYNEPSKSNVVERISLVVDHNRKNSTLSFTKVTFEDQASYLCALGDTVSHPSDSLCQEPFLEIQRQERKAGTSQSNLVSQKQNNMEIQEGEDATLPCDFKTLSSNPYLYWYRQYKHQRPERILTAYNARSRTLFCQAEKPDQEPLLEALNGRKADLSCSHPNIQSSEYIYWYRQFPSQPPHFIARGYKEPSKSNVIERISLVVDRSRKNSTLSFTKVTFEDQALYLCAIGDTVSHPSNSLCQEPFLEIQLPPETGKKGRCEDTPLNLNVQVSNLAPMIGRMSGEFVSLAVDSNSRLRLFLIP